MSSSLNSDPRVEAAAQAIIAKRSGALTMLDLARAALAAADAVDPLRQPDAAKRFESLARAVGETMDEIVGIADDFIAGMAERVEGK